MAEFPTYEQMAKNVAEKALDEFLYHGKSIREWMKIIASEDCISRQAVLDLCDSKDPNYKVIHFKEDVECLPPVNPQKVGHWIAIENEEMDTIGYFCSICDLPMETEEKTKYCPNCGCRMVDEQESDHKCHTCKHYTSGENDGSCGSYICEHYSNWESEDQE